MEIEKQSENIETSFHATESINDSVVILDAGELATRQFDSKQGGLLENFDSFMNKNTQQNANDVASLFTFNSKMSKSNDIPKGFMSNASRQ